MQGQGSPARAIRSLSIQRFLTITCLEKYSRHMLLLSLASTKLVITAQAAPGGIAILHDTPAQHEFARKAS